MRSDEDDQIAFDVLIDICAEQSSHDRYVADNRRAILNLLHILPHQTTQHDGLTVPNTDARRNFAGAEDRLVNYVIREYPLSSLIIPVKGSVKGAGGARIGLP